MTPRFDPKHPVVRLCMAGMALEDAGNAGAAAAKFRKAYDEAADDYGRFLAAYHIALRQQDAAERLAWLETSLRCARSLDDEDVRSAYPTLHDAIAASHEALRDPERAARHRALADSFRGAPADPGPFYHGTKADLKTGDLLTAGGTSNYRPDLTMNHIYFTANAAGPRLAAALAKGDGRERVYVVEPTGPFENDPNVTDRKFPGNVTRSYRSQDPLRIVGEETGAEGPSDAERRRWREDLERSRGEIIN